MRSPYRTPAVGTNETTDDIASELGSIAWGATLIVAWLADLSWLAAASSTQEPIGLDLTFAAFLVLVTGATLAGEQKPRGAL